MEPSAPEGPLVQGELALGAPAKATKGGEAASSAAVEPAWIEVADAAEAEDRPRATGARKDGAGTNAASPRDGSRTKPAAGTEDGGAAASREATANGSRADNSAVGKNPRALPEPAPAPDGHGARNALMRY